MAKVIQLPARDDEGVKMVHPAVQAVNELAASGLYNQRQYYAAIVATKRAIQITPNSREMWTNIGSYYFHTQQYAEAEAALLRALSIFEEYGLAHANLALVYEVTGHFDKARYHFDRAIALDTEGNKKALWAKSLLELRLGNYKEGFKDYEARITARTIKGVKVYPQKFPAPWYNGEPLKGKTVFMFSEQGIGDTIMFTRFLPWLRDQGCKIYLVCRLDMVGLFWEFGEFLTFIPEGVPVPEADYTMAMGSLPFWSGVTLETLPPDPGYIMKRVERYMKDVGFSLVSPRGPDPYKVGIVWRGNPAQDRDEERTVPFEQIMRVVENPHVWTYSFQVGDAESEIRKHGMDSFVYDLGPELRGRGLVACGAALLQMDLLITSCTMIAHLAGALGVPCWTLLNFDAYWPWMFKRTDSPWYPKTRLFRQVVPQNWAWVMNDVMKALDAEISASRKQETLSHG